MDMLEKEQESGGMQENSSPEGRVSQIDGEDSGREAYWNKVFAGDLRNIPQEVKEKAGVPLPLSPDDDALLAGTVVRSWAADYLPYTKEQIGSDWGEIRRGIAKRLGTGEDDGEIFLALSERNRIQRQDRDQLSGVYARSYDAALKTGRKDDSTGNDWRTTLPERLHSLGVQMEERAISEATDDRARLAPVLEKLEKGIDSFMELEAPDLSERKQESVKPGIKSFLESRPELKWLMAAPGIVDAVASMSGLDETDRRKVYGMLTRKSREKGAMGERVLRALNQGFFDIGYNTAHLGMNVYSMGVKGLGNDMKRLAGVSDEWARKHARRVRDASAIFEELKQYVRTEVAPLHDRQDGLAEQILLDGLSSAAPAALAFTGPAGVGLMVASDTGRHMAEARSMNPEGHYESQMGAAVFSGVANSVLSLGMTKLGQRVVGGALKSFRSARDAGGRAAASRILGAGAVRGVGQVAEMGAQNKAQELVQYGAQELAASASGQESGVPWDDWVERNTDASAQAREAAALFPFLLIAAGKAGLRHFRNPAALVKEGASLSKFGVPDEVIARIASEPDPDVGTALIRESIRSRPVWGSLFLGRKAFEWAKILEDPGRPLFSSEKEVREFLDMGPERIQKPWEKADFSGLAEELGVSPPDRATGARIARERWLMRSGIPRSGRNGEADLFLQHWESMERRDERMSLAGIRGRDAVIPEGLKESEVFDPSADQSKREFLSSRIEEIDRRTYKALLLKYRDSDILPAGLEHWDSVTEDAAGNMKKLIAESSIKLSGGESWDEVRNVMSSSWWRSRMSGDSDGSRAVGWLRAAVESIPEEKRWAVPLSDKLVKQAKTGMPRDEAENLHQALSEMERYSADSADSFRESLPVDFRALCRLAWADQSDARMLAHLIPNMHEFDVMTSRGFSPEKSFENVLKRHLGLAENHAADFSENQSAPGAYSWMGDVMKRLGKVTPGLMEATTGADGKNLWRVRYPNGSFSAWHKGKKEAWNDMAAHLSIIYSPVGRSRRLLMPDSNASHGEDQFTSRIREGMESLTLVDDLAVRATADLVSQGYGRRSFRAPGDELMLHDENAAVSLEKIMGEDAIAGRKEIYEKYVGPAVNVAAEASNIDIDNAKGLIINRLELYRKSSPLGMIEDRAETVWDRLLRTGQLETRQAWEALEALGRSGKRKGQDVYGDYIRLSEELSQLSKEWYLGHLDDASVPPSVSMWSRYAIARPLPSDAQLERSRRNAFALSNTAHEKMSKSDRRRIEEWSDWSMTEEMRRLADASRSLPGEMEKSGISAQFVSMLADSAGMNRHARVERVWAMEGQAEKNIFPVMERYVHSLSVGNLLDVLPKHMVEDMIPVLARGKGGIFSNREKLARHALSELSENLRLYPEISLWNPDVDHPGGYFVLKEKTYPAFADRSGNSTSSWETKLAPAEVKQPGGIDHDWMVNKAGALPEAWRKNPAIARSIETLGLIRRDFAARPVPSREGIYWKGQVIRHDSPFAPGGIPDSWMRDIPLGSGLEAIFRLERSGEVPQGAHYPLIHDWKEALNRYDHCVLYMNPNDRSHTIRLMPGMPESALKEARAPYVVHAWDGVFFDESGQVAHDYRDSYIPLERFQFQGSLPEISFDKRREYKAGIRRKLLDEIADAGLQKKFWWDARSGDGGFSESVIRLYEELGVRKDYERGRLKLTDPVFVETLRFVAHVVNSPKWLAGGFEYGTPSHRVILEEGGSWKKMMEKSGE